MGLPGVELGAKNQVYLPCIQTAADISLLYIANPNPAEDKRNLEPDLSLTSVLQATGSSTEVLLVGTGYDKGLDPNGLAGRDPDTKREELTKLIEPVSNLCELGERRGRQLLMYRRSVLFHVSGAPHARTQGVLP